MLDVGRFWISISFFSHNVTPVSVGGVEGDGQVQISTPFVPSVRTIFFSPVDNSFTILFRPLAFLSCVSCNHNLCSTLVNDHFHYSKWHNFTSTLTDTHTQGSQGTLKRRFGLRFFPNAIFGCTEGPASDPRGAFTIVLRGWCVFRPSSVLMRRKRMALMGV